VVVPNIRGALVSASFLSVALVLGEFTIASLLNFNNLQVTINLLGKRDAAVSVAVSLASLAFAFVLLLALSFVGRRRSSSGVTEEG
jgi:putative spermidine/putrescine transport system permease protein